MPSQHPPVAVVGASALFPGSPAAERFWRNIVDGADLFSDVPASHWNIDDYYDPTPATPDKIYVRRGGFLPDVEFSPMDFGIPPNALPATDTAQLLALMVAQHVLEDLAGSVGGDLSRLNRERVSVILGAAGATELLGSMSGRLQQPIWERTLRAAGLPEPQIAALSERLLSNYTPWQENTFPGLLGNVIAGRIANRFDLGGTNCVIDAACASSLAALEVGLNELYLGKSDVVITGGVDACNDINMFMCFSTVTAMSPTGDCRPFSDQSDGTMLGEGLAMFALKRLDDAERDGDRIYAVIRGLGTSSDGRAKSIYAPSPAGQAKALRRAYAAAGYGPDTVGLVEAHGTGTKAGDVAEFAALREVFDESGREDRQWCALGSVKSQVGHTKGAAGACGLFKTVMALHHKALPPTIKVERPHPALDIENTPFYLSTRTTPWIADNGVPRRASVSSFGFGGTNFHVTVEEYTGSGRRAFRHRSWDSELVVLGAASAAALADDAGRLSGSLVDSDDMLSSLAHSTQSAYDAAQHHRLAIVADSVADLRAKLDDAVAHLRQEDLAASFSSPKGYFYSARHAGPVALLFPGQGSQYVGMGAEIPQLFGPALAAWERGRAEDLNADRDLHRVVWPKTAFTDGERALQAAELTKTEWAQPGIGAHSLSLLSVIRALGITPVSVGGHSFGEVSALCAAGVFSEDLALRIARARGVLMAQSAADTDGAMCAVSAPVEEVRRLIADWGLSVVVANHNAPDQVVLSGDVASITDAAQRFGGAGMNARRLDVATAFHSEIVSPAAAPFAEFLAAVPFDMPRVPVYANATAAPYAGGAADMRATLAGQIAQPVRFAEQVQAMWQAGARTFVEVGPGGVLTNLVGKCLADRDHSAVSLDAKGRHGIRSLWLGLAQLVAAGVPMDFDALWADYRVGNDPRTRSTPKLTLSINGSNYGKPHPYHQPHLPESEPALAPAESPRPVPPMTVPSATPSAPLSTNGSHAGVPAAADVSADAIAAITAAVATLRDNVDQVQRLLDGLVARTPVAAPRAAPPASSNGHATLPVPPAAPASTNGGPALPLAPVPPAVPVAHNGSAAPAAPAAPASELITQMLAVVADKTGYPVEMLDLSMALEADLGIDSIKRVEILSAVQERIPTLPDVETSTMATLATLQEIIDYLHGLNAPGLNGTQVGGRLPFELAGAEIARYAVRAVAAPASGMGMPGLYTARNVEIVASAAGHDNAAGDADTAEALAAILRTHGIGATIVTEPSADAEAVIHLGGLRRTAGRADTLGVNRAVFADAQRVAATFAEHGGVFITVQDTGGTFGLLTDPGPRAWAGGIAALAKTAAQEWPRAQIKAIDIAVGSQAPVSVAEHLAQEIVAGGAELEVGLGSTHGRVTVVAGARPVTTHTPRVESSDVIIVSGGGRGVTAASVIALARQTQASFLLIGRTELGDEPPEAHGLTTDAELKRALLTSAAAQGLKPTPKDLDHQARRIMADREVRATLAGLTAAGSRVRYAAADVRDPAQLGALLDDVRTDFGPITGVVHGAGVLADAPLQKKTLAGFDRVFETKVGGLCALLDATATDPLKLVCLFSSVAARSGNVGQSDYAMANEILNKVALAEQARRGPGCLVRALGWGPWDSGMVTPGLKSMFESRGISLIPLAAGAQAFVAEVLDGDTGSPEVILGDGVLAGLPTHPLPTEGRVARVVAHAARQPHLLDHRIQGNVVLPVVQALEWCVRMAEACRPGHRVDRILDLKVLRGAALREFEQHGDPMLARCAPAADQPDRLTFTLSDGSGTTDHYSAIVEMASGTTRARAGAPNTPGEGMPAPQGRRLDRADCYTGGALFHGPAFQMLHGVECGDSTATASLSGTAAAGWAGDGWATDPAALDGCLQMALVWSFERLGRTVLPLRVAEVIRYQAGALGDGLRCVLSNGDARNNRAVCDLDLVDADDLPVASLKRLELYPYGG